MAHRDFFAWNSRKQCGQTHRSGVQLQFDCLEQRTVPYAATGNAWPHPELVTLSFMPDGANLGGPASNLFAKFNASFGSSSAWQNVLLKAAQVWAQQTNLNFSVIGDSGVASGSGSYQQGDPAIGDIRFGGFNFNNSSLLALGYMPPPVNNYSVAGDIGINTAKVFNINGADYDLYTVMVHEIGHALGMNHSGSGAAIMYSAYEGSMPSLSSDDIAGIRAVYGARRDDAFDASGANGSFAIASDLSGSIGGRLSATISGLDITTTSDVDYYKFTVPAGASGTMALSVQSQGLSLLAPSLRVYNGSQTQVASATGFGYLGSNLTTTFNVSPGQQYFVRVAGANPSAFGTGAYALGLNFAGGPTSVARSAYTLTPNGNPMNGGGGVANRTDRNGVSVTSLLVGIDRTTYRLVGGGLLGNLVDSVVSSAIQLPFVSAMEADDVRFPAGRLSPIAAAPQRAVGVIDGGTFPAMDAKIAIAFGDFSVGSRASIPQTAAIVVASPAPLLDTTSYLASMIGFSYNTASDLLETKSPKPAEALKSQPPRSSDPEEIVAKLDERRTQNPANEVVDQVTSIDEWTTPARTAGSLLLPSLILACGLNMPPADETLRHRSSLLPRR